MQARKLKVSEFQQELLKQTIKPQDQAFIALKMQLLMGVDDPDQQLIARRIFRNNKEYSGNIALLVFLMQEGVFNHYADLYPSHDITFPGSAWIILTTAAGFGTAPIGFFGFYGVILTPLTGFAGMIAGCGVASNQLDNAAQKELFLRLDKIQLPEYRHVFIKMTIALYESRWMPDITSCKNLIASLKSSEITIDIKWSALLTYMANVSANNGSSFYMDVANINHHLQDSLGFQSLHAFSIFAATRLPKEIHTRRLPKEIYTRIGQDLIDLSIEDLKQNRSP